MKKTILHTMLALALSMTATSAWAVESEWEMQEIEATINEIQISVSGHTLRISNAEGKRAAIYDTAGNLIMVVDIDSNEKYVNISGRGIFIVKIDQRARKIQIC